MILNPLPSLHEASNLPRNTRHSHPLPHHMRLVVPEAHGGGLLWGRYVGGALGLGK
jgi:hypothetical protein